MRSTLARTLSAMLAVTVIAGVAAYSAADPSDPLISLSYITETFVPQVLESAESAAEDAVQLELDEAFAPALGRLEGLDSVDTLAASAVAAAQLELAQDGWYRTTARNVAISLEEGERIRFRCGAEFVLTAGSATLDGERAAEFVHTTSGGGAYVGLAAATNGAYILVSDSIAGLRATSDCEVLVSGEFQVIPGYTVSHTDMADLLAAMNLFRGTGNGYSLEREATRLEALIMFLRLIGEEEAALAYTGSHPFTDVPYWEGGTADRYIAYAYNMGYTNGVSATLSGASDTVTFEQYVTFLLRALGYSSETDFEWSDAPAAAVRFGVITEAERENFLRRGFYRDGVAYLSFRALFAPDKGQQMVLVDRLVAQGVVTVEQAESAAAAQPELIV